MESQYIELTEMKEGKDSTSENETRPLARELFPSEESQTSQDEYSYDEVDNASQKNAHTQNTVFNFIFHFLYYAFVAGACLMLGFAIFGSSANFGLAVLHKFLLTGVLGSSIGAIALAALAIIILRYLFTHATQLTIQSSIAETPVWQLIEAAAQAEEILAPWESIIEPKRHRISDEEPSDEAPFSPTIADGFEQRERTTLYENSLAMPLLARKITVTISEEQLEEGLQSLETSTQILSEANTIEPIWEHIEQIKLILNDKGCEQGNNNLAVVKEALARAPINDHETFNALGFLNNITKVNDVMKMHSADRKKLSIIFSIIKNHTVIDTDDKRPYSNRRKIALFLISLIALMGCVTTLSFIFTTGITLSMTGSMLPAAALGIIFWISTQHLLRKIRGGTYATFAAFFGTSFIIFIMLGSLGSTSLAATILWPVASGLFILSALCGWQAYKNAIRDTSNSSQLIEKIRSNQNIKTLIHLIKIALFLGALLLAFSSVAMVLQLKNLGPFSSLLDFALSIANQKTNNFELATQWIGASFIGIFSASIFMAFVLGKNLCQISPATYAEFKKHKTLISGFFKSLAFIAMIGSIVYLATKPSIFAAGSHVAILPMLLVTLVVMPWFSDNANQSYFKGLKYFNELFNHQLFYIGLGVGAFAKGDWFGVKGRNYLVREMLVLSILISISLLTGYFIADTAFFSSFIKLTGPATEYAVIAWIGIGITMSVRWLNVGKNIIQQRLLEIQSSESPERSSVENSENIENEGEEEEEEVEKPQITEKNNEEDAANKAISEAAEALLYQMGVFKTLIDEYLKHYATVEEQPANMEARRIDSVLLTSIPLTLNQVDLQDVELWKAIEFCNQRQKTISKKNIELFEKIIILGRETLEITQNSIEQHPAEFAQINKILPRIILLLDALPLSPLVERRSPLPDSKENEKDKLTKRKLPLSPYSQQLLRSSALSSPPVSSPLPASSEDEDSVPLTPKNLQVLIPDDDPLESPIPPDSSFGRRGSLRPRSSSTTSNFDPSKSLAADLASAKDDPFSLT